MISEIPIDGCVWLHPDDLPPGHSPYSPQRARKHAYVAQIDLQGETESASFYKLEPSFTTNIAPRPLPNRRCLTK
jgi:hypothetical protein